MQITNQEISDLADIWWEAQSIALDKILKETAAPFMGRRFKKVLVLGSKKAGNLAEYTIEATVDGCTFGCEDGMILVGTYTHPITGKPAKAQFYVDEFPGLVEDGATAGGP